MAKFPKVAVLPSLSASPLAADRIAAAAAVTTKLAQATPTHIKQAAAPSNLLSYVVEPFSAREVAVFDACLTLERAHYEVDNKRAAITSAVRALFADCVGGPTYAMYRSLQDAVRLQAIEAGYEGQAMRKHVATAVKAAYGALPVSDSPAAIAKRAQRPGKTAKAPAVDTLPDTASEGAGMRMPSKEESIESFIARVGMVAALAAAMRILDAVDETKAEAAVIGSVIGHLTTPQQKAA